MSNDNQISTDEVRRIAKLARLTVTDGEAAALTKDTAEILAYVDKLNELDVSAVEATSHAIELQIQAREDVVFPGLGAELSLANAPERISDGFGVPKIIE